MSQPFMLYFNNRSSDMEDIKTLLPKNLAEDITRITESDINFSRFENKTVLISSACSMLGFYTVCAFLISNDLYDTGIKVVAADNSDEIFSRYGKLTQRSDIDFLVTEDFSNLHNTKADFIINIAPPKTESEISNLISYVKENKPSVVINSFSDIYGDVFNGRDMIFESDLGYLDSFKPECRSALLERAFESCAKLISRQYGIDIRFSRLCQVFGCKEYGLNPSYMKVFKDVVEKKKIEILQSDRELKSYIYVTDAAVALIKILLDGSACEAYNVSSGYVASNHIIAEYCVKLFQDIGIEIIYTEKEKTLSPMASTIDVLDNAKLKALGFSCETDMQTGILRAVKIIYEAKG